MLPPDARISPPGRKRRRFLPAFLLALAVVGATLGAGAWLARAEPGTLPPDVQVAGVPVGGHTLDEARQLIEAAARKRLDRPIRLTYSGGELTTTGQALKAWPRIDEALAKALRSRNGIDRLWARLGLTSAVEIPLEYVIDRKRLLRIVRKNARDVERPARSAGVEVIGRRLVLRSSVPGVALDGEGLGRRLALLPASAMLAFREVTPRVSNAVAEGAKAQAEALLDQPPFVVFRKARYEPSSELLARALRFRKEQARMVVALDPVTLEHSLRRVFERFEQPPRDASFRIVGSRVEVVPAREGRTLAVERVAAALVKHAGAPRIRALFEKAAPRLTTSAARRLRIRELVSEFATPYACCQPRVTNIKLAAEILDGQIIRPRARFDLNKRLGQRTPERGFVPAPTIYDGRLRDDVGGGVSQIATTIYNAAFFAGLELIAHTPHQFYISRYPMGREATVSWGGPELVFRNDWPAAILVKVFATDTQLTVRLYSSMLRRRVETETSEPYDQVAPAVLREFNPELAPGEEVVIQDGGVSGFSVEYTRKVYRGSRLLRDESYHVRYEAEDTVIEYGPKAQEPAPSGGQPPAGDGDAEPSDDSTRRLLGFR